MRCQEVNRLLTAYLDNEVTPSEHTLVRAHLAGCDRCQQELAALSALQGRVSQFLQAKASRVAPSPQAWSRLQARLAKEAPPSPEGLPRWRQRLAPGVGGISRILGGVTMKKGVFALTILAGLVIALSAVAFVPSVRAQVGELLRWFRFQTPAGGGEVSIPGSVEFTPLRPTYLPAGFQAMAVGLNPEAASLNFWNSATDQILIIDQWKAASDDDRSLPRGMRMTVSGQPAVLITGLEGNISFVSIPPTPSAPVATPAEPGQIVPLEPSTGGKEEHVAYTEGKQLIWYVGDVRVEILSNLPVEEMLKVAESMVPAEEDINAPVSNP